MLSTRLPSCSDSSTSAPYNFKHEPPSAMRRWSSRQRLPRCSRSSIPRPAISHRSSMRCSKRRCGSARRRLEAYGPSMMNSPTWLQIAACPRALRRCCANRFVRIRKPESGAYCGANPSSSIWTWRRSRPIGPVIRFGAPWWISEARGVRSTAMRYGRFPTSRSHCCKLRGTGRHRYGERSSHQ